MNLNSKGDTKQRERRESSRKEDSFMNFIHSHVQCGGNWESPGEISVVGERQTGGAQESQGAEGKRRRASECQALVRVVKKSQGAPGRDRREVLRRVLGLRANYGEPEIVRRS